MSEYCKQEIKTEQEETSERSGGFLCPMCGAHFFSEEYFDEHIREHQSNVNCVVKQEIKPEPEEDIVKSEPVFICPICTDCLHSDTVLIKHVKQHHDHNGLDQCDNEDFKSREELMSFDKNCRNMSQRFDSVDSLTQADFSKKTDVGTSAQSSENDVSAKSTSDLDDKLYYECSHCSYSTSIKFHFSAHQRTHTGEKPYKCTECSFAASEWMVLIRHQRTHTGEKPFKCTLCSYAATQKIHLTHHLRRHSGEKPYKCTKCSYAGVQKSGLVRHQRTHTGEKLYKCNLCSYAAAQKGTLVRHLKTHAREVQ